MIRRRRLCTGAWAAALGVASAPAWASLAAGPRAGSLTVAITRPEALCQLPLHLAHRLGYAAEEGLRLDWLLCPDLDAAVQALASGRAQVVSAPYALTLKVALQGMRWTAFVLQSRTPQYALGMSRPGYEALARGTPLRLAVPKGSDAAYRVAQQFLARQQPLQPPVQWVEVAGAEPVLELLRNKGLDGACLPDPHMSRVERDGGVRVVADTRTLNGTRQLFGTLWPAASLCTSVELSRQRAEQCRALTHAVVHAQKWLQTAGMLDVSRAVAEEHFRGDRGLYLSAFAHNREAWSPDGVFDEGAPDQMRRVLARWSPVWADADTSLAHTVTNQWAKEAKSRFRA
jgi:NitT/TauT family transport system substrate-binding protein